MLAISYYLVEDVLFLFFGLKYQEGLLVFYILNLGIIVQIFCFDYLLRGIEKTKTIGIVVLVIIITMMMIEFQNQQYS